MFELVHFNYAANDEYLINVL